jgi:transaldolase
MDPAEAKKLPFVPMDQTSNQRLVYQQMIAPENRELFLKIATELKDEGWKAIYFRMVSDQLIFLITPYH